MKWTKIKNEGLSSIFKSDCSVATGKRMHKGDLAGPIIIWSGSCKKGKVHGDGIAIYKFKKKGEWVEEKYTAV